MHPPQQTSGRTTARRRRFPTLALTLACLTLPLGLAGCGGDEAGPKLALSAALPEEPAEDTVLRVGDPATQTALELSGLDDELDIEVEWANISGGPKTLEAFRGDALDLGAVADIPPLFAQWTGTDVKVVAARETVDPLEHPTYELGVAPGVDVAELPDLRGKKIAYSPGQAQGSVVLRVLREAGLTQDDVELVEMASVDDVYVNALGSGQVDVAPLGQSLVPPYLAKYEQDGGTTISPGVRDDAWTLYTPTEVIEDADKAAAIKEYVAVWALAQQWIAEHPEEFAQGFYVEHEGLAEADARAIVEALGTFEVPTDWSDVIARHQEIADLLAEEQDREPLDLDDLYDRRFEKVIAASVAASGGA
ncbi:ABC transporter substrate-binding protein [Nocardioides sp. W7]|uniref:ABC transporter substrate-binding protein n=1 Tax=Nocardioides sp. W7 TaxID=2931390 RepID=UPI001FD34CA1|nr:ABC transporter substrate-binding protein [Nocardioides sp. W7]